MRATTTEHGHVNTAIRFLAICRGPTMAGDIRPGPRRKRDTKRHAMDLAEKAGVIGSRKVGYIPPSKPQHCSASATTHFWYHCRNTDSIVILRRLWPGVIDICILKLRSRHSLRSQIITLQLMAISWYAPGLERVFAACTAPNNCIYQLSRIPFALLRFKIFLPVRVRSLDKKPCLRFTTRRVALFVGLLDLCRTCDTDEVTAGPRIEAGEGVMVGD